MLWHRQVIYESKGDKLSFSAEWRIRTQARLSWKHLGPLTTRYIIRDTSHGKAMRERWEKAGHYDDDMQITHINIMKTQISHFERYPVTIRNQYGKNSDAMLYLPVFSVNTTIQIIHMEFNVLFAYSFEKFLGQIYDIALTKIGLMLRGSGRFWHENRPDARNIRPVVFIIFLSTTI